MRRLSFVGGALAIAFVGAAMACGSEPQSHTPFSPIAPGPTGLQVTGPSTVPPGTSAQFSADTRLNDGTVKSNTSGTSIRWRTSNPSVLQVSATGLATALNRGEAILTAEVLPGATIRGTREVVIVPEGTYRVVGTVRAADSSTEPVVGARVEVTGTPLVATTDFAGQYRLYGVPPAAEIRVTANGYVSTAQTVQLTAHTTQNFVLPLTSPRVILNGLYLVKFDAACSGGSPALPASLQHRSYEATVTTTGSLVDVRLTEPRFKIDSGSGNRFTGHADPAGVTFSLFAFYYYYYYGLYASVAERLPDNSVLAIYGQATTFPVGGGVSGPLSGNISNYDSRFPSFNAALLGRCSSGLQLTIVPR